MTASIEPDRAGSLDHLVITTPDLASACDEFEARLGVRPVEGGRHPQFGTHNALLGLGGDAYVELIAIDPSAPTRESHPFELDTVTGTGACTFAVHPDDLDAAARVLSTLGFDVGPAGPGRRSTPEGTELSWELTAPLATGHWLVPFLIDWQGGPSPADSIVPRVELSGWGASHPEADAINRALESLGVPLPVVVGEPDFWVELSGPGGSWRL